ncbi:MAG: hypothetical protein HZA04_03510 [Nitrospinae bacterium]|nr:hypothetical protein [Nitrospinota bacterium]
MENGSEDSGIDFIAAILSPIGIFFLGCAFALALNELPGNFHSQNLYYVVASGGVILALFTYLINRQRENKQRQKELIQRQNEIYRAIDDKYFSYLQHCMANPELDVYDIPNLKIPYDPGKEADKKKELIAYTMLISLMEIAFIEYLAAPKSIKDNQEWAWHEYIKRFAGRENFKWAWNTWNENESFLFDKRFVAYMEELMK